METYDYLLLGGGVAAYSAAKRILKADPSGRLLMVSDEHLPPYDLPPLSKDFLKGVKSEVDIVFPDFRRAEAVNAHLRLNTRAEALDVGSRTVTLSDGEVVGFGKALLATGSSPIRLTAPGADLPGIHYLRTAKDSLAIAASARGARRAVVIGAGFIGLETAASLRQMGLEVAVVEAMPRIWPRFPDADLAAFIQDHCAALGISFLTDARVTQFKGGDQVAAVLTADGEVLPCDLVCVGVGIRPNVRLAVAAGLKVDDGIMVDETMQTSAPGVYAAGDAISYHDPIMACRRRAEHWGHAEYSGQIAGMNMGGGHATYDFMNYAWSDLFDLHIEMAGHPEDYDTRIVRGEVSAAAFLVLYLRGGILRAFCGVNADPKDFTTLRRFIRERRDLSGRLGELADHTTNVRSLA